MSMSHEGGAIILETADCAHGSLYNHRVTSCGSVASAGDMRGSQSSIRHGSRFSCISGVRDESQTIDEFRRKQRVIRYMEEEREQAERGKVERSEHLDWVNFRLLERQERFKLLSVQEVSEILKREAQDVEREKFLVEEALRRGAEAALERQRVAASMTPKTRSQEKMETVSREENAVGGEQQWAGESPEIRIAEKNLKNCDVLKREYEQREQELLSKLRMAQDDAAAAKVNVEEVKRRLAAAEEELLQQSGRTAEETAARKKAEARVAALETKMGEMLKKMSEMKEQLEAMKCGDGENELRLAKLEQQLNSKQQQLKSLQQDKTNLTTKCGELLAANAALTKRLNNMQRNNVVGKQLFQQSEDNKLINTRSPPGQRAATTDAGRIEEKRSNLGNACSLGEGNTKKRGSFTSENDVVKNERLEQLEKEAMKYKKEVEAARQELNKMRESYDREIESLQEWCSRLNEKCNRQTEELRGRVLRGEICNSSGDSGITAAGGKGSSTPLPEVERAEHAARVAELTHEINEVKAQLKKSQESEKRAVDLLNIFQSQAQNYPVATKDKDPALFGAPGFPSANVGEPSEMEDIEHRELAIHDKRGAPSTATTQSVPQVIALQPPDRFAASGVAFDADENMTAYGTRRISGNLVCASRELDNCAPVVAGGDVENATARHINTYSAAGSAEKLETRKKTSSLCCFFAKKK